jgi:alpha-1,6-mannosyltransferase
MTQAAVGMRWDRRMISLAVMAIGLCAVTAATHALHWRIGGWVLIGAFAVGTVCALTAGPIAGKADERIALAIILVGAAAMRLMLLVSEPTLSSDIYRYVWDGRVQAAGINPYRYVPAAEELATLRDPEVWPHINRADYAVSLYPPGAQFVFVAATRLGESVLAMKFALLLFEAAGIAAITALLRRLGKPSTSVAAYAWHPLPVWEIAGNGHVDAAMMAFLLLGLLLYVRGRTLIAGVLITLGALVKPLAVVVLPVLWRPWDWRLPICVAVTFILAYVPYLSVGWGVFGFVSGYVEEEGLASGNGFKLLWLLQQLTGPLLYGTASYLAVSMIVLAAIALAVGFRTDRAVDSSLRGAGWMLIAFLVLISPNYPWYFLVLVPFLALSPSATAWVLTSASVLFYDIVPGDVLPAYETRVTVFTLGVLAALACDLWGEWNKGAPASVGETT